MENITKYIEGKLTPIELEGFSEQLIEAKLDRDKKRAWTKQLEVEYGVERIPQKQTPIQKSNNNWLLGLVASLLLLLSLFFLMPANGVPTHVQLADNYIEQLSIMGDQSVSRKGKENVDSIRQKATVSYDQGRYQESIRNWSKIILYSEAIGSDYFYLGLCHLKSTPSAPEETITHLLKSRLLDGPPDEIAWVLSLAYLKTGAIEEAKKELRMVVNRGNYQIENAKRIMKHLKTEDI